MPSIVFDKENLLRPVKRTKLILRIAWFLIILRKTRDSHLLMAKGSIQKLVTVPNKPPTI